MTSLDWIGLRYWYALRRVRDTAERYRVTARFNRAFGRRLAAARQLESAGVVWGFRSQCVELFEAAARRGVPGLLEQVSLPRPVEAEVLEQEAARWPGWEPGLALGQRTDPIYERQLREWELAARIIAPSRYVARELERTGVERSKIRTIPIPVELDRFGLMGGRPLPRGAPLHVLCVGNVNLQKGIPYLLEALRALGPERVRGRFVGCVHLDRRRLAPYAEVAQFVGHVPRTQIAEEYRWAHVLAFPTLCDSFGNVQAEAMARGLPVVATPNCGDVVRDGVDGRVVPIRSVEALAAALRAYIDDPALLAAHQRAAAAGRERLGRVHYERGLAGLLAELVE